mmetsp:Transcript_4757/g.17568  ORF Transcript_4757/g.17568 Transcript_4757/m.17568 type:complete len:208 (+) Transcript_4757:226-849(+)
MSFHVTEYPSVPQRNHALDNFLFPFPTYNTLPRLPEHSDARTVFSFVSSTIALRFRPRRRSPRAAPSPRARRLRRLALIAKAKWLSGKWLSCCRPAFQALTRSPSKRLPRVRWMTPKGRSLSAYVFHRKSRQNSWIPKPRKCRWTKPPRRTNLPGLNNTRLGSSGTPHVGGLRRTSGGRKRARLWRGCIVQSRLCIFSFRKSRFLFF